MTKPIRILHLSDIHLTKAKAWDYDRVLGSLNGSILGLDQKGLRPDIIALTGDLACNGTKDDYQQCHDFIQNLSTEALHGFDSNNILIIPGNHDIDRKQIKSFQKHCEQYLAKASQDDLADFFKSDDKNVILKRHKDYLGFANSYRTTNKLKFPWWSKKFKFGNITLGFAGIATSIIAYGEDQDDHGRLIVSRYQLNDIFSKLQDTNIRIALMHHPYDYLTTNEIKEVKGQLFKNASILLRGHLHEAKCDEHKINGEYMLELATGAVYDNSNNCNSFQLIEIDPDKSKLRVHYKCWQDNDWKTDYNAYKVNRTKGYAEFKVRMFGKPKITKVQDSVKYDSLPLVESWTRMVPKMPLPHRVRSKLGNLLDNIRRRVYESLKSKNPKLKDKHIRANIFLADYNKADMGYPLKLLIPQDLHKNMNFAPELGIEFLPDQGATGISFSRGYIQYARRLSKNQGHWDSLYKITTEQQKKVHKNLKWVYSIPLKDTTNQSIGVMNIDGLKYYFKKDTLTKIILAFYADIYALACYLSKQPKITIVTGYKEMKK